MHYACMRGTPRLLELMLDAHADVINVHDNEGRTPLLIALIYGHFKAVSLLSKNNSGDEWNELQWRHDLENAGVDTTSMDSALLASIQTISALSEARKARVKLDLVEYLVKVRPDDYLSLRRLGLTYRLQGKLLDADVFHDRSLKLDPSNRYVTEVRYLIHSGIWCDDCLTYPIKGYRFTCIDCGDLSCVRLVP
jgi:ankyrin repeat protein